MISIMFFRNSLGILTIYYNFLVSQGLHGIHMNTLNPIISKLRTLTLDPKIRFVNLFSYFSLLCAMATPHSKIGIK